MQELEHAMRRASGSGAIFSQAVADYAGISSSDRECLDFLILEGRAPAGRLAEVTGLTTGAITGVIDRLEKAGFVRRERDEHDRRKVFIILVPQNIARVGVLYEHMQRAMLKNWDSYTDDELRLLLRFASQGYETMLAAKAELLRNRLKRGADRGLGQGFISLRRGEHAPHRAEHHPEVTPVVGVDDKGLTDGAEKRREDRQIDALPGHRPQQVPKSHDDRDRDQGRIAKAGKPAARHEGIQIGVVGVFGEVIVELQRTDAKRQIECHVGAENMTAEAAKAAFVVALVEARALLEHLGDGIERQQHGNQQHQQDNRYDGDHHDPGTLR